MTVSRLNILLTFDDEPNWNTTETLELLNRHSAISTFYVDIHRAFQCKSLMKDIIAEGHEIGLHGVYYLNSFLNNRSVEKNNNYQSHISHWRHLDGGSHHAGVGLAAMIEYCKNSIEDIVQSPIRSIRPPYGMEEYLRDYNSPQKLSLIKAKYNLTSEGEFINLLDNTYQECGLTRYQGCGTKYPLSWEYEVLKDSITEGLKSKSLNNTQSDTCTVILSHCEIDDCLENLRNLLTNDFFLKQSSLIKYSSVSGIH